MAIKKLCKTCKFFEQLGLEDSGLFFPESSEQWIYPVGKCCNKKSVHGGWTAKEWFPPRTNLAGWASCEHWKRKKSIH